MGGCTPLFPTPNPLTLSFLLFGIGAIKLPWIMPIPLLGKNKTIGFCDLVVVFVVFQKKKIFFKVNFLKSNATTHIFCILSGVYVVS